MSSYCEVCGRFFDTPHFCQRPAPDRGESTGCLECARLRAENARLTEFFPAVVMAKDEAMRTVAWLEARNAEQAQRIAELEAALRQAADEPNIDKARAIADAALSGREG